MWLLRALGIKQLTVSWSWNFWGVKKMSNWKYFDDAEVAKSQLVPELYSKLDVARSKTVTPTLPNGVPFIITSGRRTPDGNSVLKGAVPDSSHLTGQGADLWIEDDQHMYAMLQGLYAAGFRRIGIYFMQDTADANRLIPRHFHVDIDETKPQDCCFVKREQN